VSRCWVLVALLLALSGCGRDASPNITDAWIRSAPPGAPMAGYLDLHNPGDRTLRCDGASSEAFDSVELHRSVVEDGMSRMLHGQIAELAAGGRLRFEPGGYHLMLFGARRPLARGDSAVILLHCGELRIAAEFIVRDE